MPPFRLRTLPNSLGDSSTILRNSCKLLQVIKSCLCVSGPVILLNIALTSLCSASDLRVNMTTAYPFQFSTSFDCLDGARVDPASGAVVLFGHRTNGHKFLHVAYFAYLAEALNQTGSPTFSLEPRPETYAGVQAIDNLLRDEVSEGLKEPFDQHGTLKAHSAWFLRQAGISIQPGATGREVLALIARTSGHESTASMWETMDQLATTGVDDPQKSRALFDILGISSVTDRIDHAVQEGTLSREQGLDEYYSVLLRAIAQKMDVDSHKYTERYDAHRKEGDTPQLALAKLQQIDIAMDTKAQMDRAFWQILQAKKWIGVPPWVDTGSTKRGSLRVDLVYRNVSPQSWLGRTLYDADVFLKSIGANGPLAEPSLKAAVPGFVSEQEFLDAHGFSSAYDHAQFERLTIVPGAFQIAQSTDGQSVQFVDTPMEVEDKFLKVDSNGNRTDVAEPAHDQYGQFLSAHYNEFADAYPSLYKVREAAKVVAIARWLQKRGFRVVLPAGAQLTWDPPEWIPAIFDSYLKIDPGEVRSFSVSGSGGVVLAPDRNWTITEKPIVAPSSDLAAAAPTAAQTSSNESTVRDFLATTPSLPQKAASQLQLAAIILDRGDTHAAMREIDRAVQMNPENTLLLLFAAQTHFDNGDSYGAAQIMRAYLASDPNNAPARRMLSHFAQKSPTTPAQVATAGSSAVLSTEGLTPLGWNSPVTRSYYANDERAPELTDIHVPSPQRPLSIFQPPAIPDFIQLLPAVVGLQEKRAQLAKAYYQAPPGERPVILTQIKQVDVQVIQKAAQYGSVLQSPAPGPQTPSATPERPKEKPDEKLHYKLDD
jgi:hypothetical protein